MRRAAHRLFACAAILASIGLTACAASDRTFASRNDYWAYRQYRLAGTTLERLRHGNRYLKDVPGGRFRPEVAAWFAQQESAFYEQARDRPSWLRAYLAAMPDGPNAERVIDRLLELEALREYRRRHVERQEQEISRIESALAEARDQRQAFVGLLSDLIRLLSQIRALGKPTSEVDQALRLLLQRPGLRCSASACVEVVRLPYAIPEAKQLAKREGVLELELALDAGVVRSATLRGPELFSRLSEAASVAPVSNSDFASRLDALARVTALVENAVEPAFPSVDCARDVVAPVLLTRECHGVRVELVAGGEPGSLDFLRVVPAASKDRRPAAPQKRPR